jgi:hypothetical protein
MIEMATAMTTLNLKQQQPWKLQQQQAKNEMLFSRGVKGFIT